MKKIFLTLLLLCFSVSLCACGNKAGMINPYEEVESLNKLNEIAGTNIRRVNASEEKYFFINTTNIAEYSFNYKGDTYTLRAKKTEEDISGIYPSYTDTTLGYTKEEKEVLPTMDSDGNLWARWYKDDTQYFLSSYNVTLEEFTDIYEFIK